MAKDPVVLPEPTPLPVPELVPMMAGVTVKILQHHLLPARDQLRVSKVCLMTTHAAKINHFLIQMEAISPILESTGSSNTPSLTTDTVRMVSAFLIPTGPIITSSSTPMGRISTHHNHFTTKHITNIVRTRAGLAPHLPTAATPSLVSPQPSETQCVSTRALVSTQAATIITYRTRLKRSMAMLLGKDNLAPRDTIRIWSNLTAA